MSTYSVAFLILVAILSPAEAQEFHFFGEELKPVLEILQDAHLSASVGLSGRCDPAHLPGIPRLTGAPVRTSSPVGALRALAASDREMRVKQDADGTIRMTERGVPDDILNVRISHISFEDYGHDDIYSAGFAVHVIFSAPEVRSFLKAHDIDAPQLRRGNWRPKRLLAARPASHIGLARQRHRAGGSGSGLSGIPGRFCVLELPKDACKERTPRNESVHQTAGAVRRAAGVLGIAGDR